MLAHQNLFNNVFHSATVINKPTSFLAESRTRRLNQGSFVYFLLFVLCLCENFL